jgi:mannosyl-3-phosphoglycerate phosphatase
MRLILTDLDGTLLDHDTYSAEAARPALASALERGVPVVPCSSKTLAEMRTIARRLSLAPAPLIVENGGAIWFPDRWNAIPAAAGELADGGRLLALGVTADVIRPQLAAISAASGVQVRGFSGMTDTEVAERTGLPLEVAALARRRLFSEPFLCVDGQPDLASLNAAAATAGLRVTRGGRFFHLIGPIDKGSAAGVVVSACPPGTRTLGLGDAPNDLSLLRATTDAVIVPQPGRGLHPELVAALPMAMHAPAVGPEGWNAAVLAWLDHTAQPR